MDPGKITRQMIGFNKAVFDNTFSGLAVLQDSTKNMMNGFLRQFPWVTTENRKALDTSFDMMKQARENYKKAIDEGFAKMEEMADLKKDKTS